MNPDQSHRFVITGEDRCPVSTAEAGHPTWCPTDPTEAEPCPGCGATHGVQPKPAPPQVQAWTCTVCGLHWATTAVDPALSIVGLLPTPQLRTAALLATLRTEVTRRTLAVRGRRGAYR